MLGVRRLLAVAVVVTAATSTGCDSGNTHPSGPSTGTPSSVAAVPQVPHVDGPVAVRVRPGLAVVSGDRCPATRGQLCSADGRDAWVPLGAGRAAILAEASTGVSADHTSWTTTLRFDEAGVIGVVAQRAAAAGGYLLVVGRGAVLAAVPPSAVHRGTVRLEDLPKPEAWAFVEAFVHLDR